jgi:hypothetical protein
MTSGHVGYCAPCGYRFLDVQDKVRLMAAKPKSAGRAVAVLAGLAIAVVQYVLVN